MAVPPLSNVSAAATGTDFVQTKSNTIDQSDFIKLFLAQLQFQDPLEPVDNREFLAQMAQFSALEQARQTTKNTEDQLLMSEQQLALSLIGRAVQVQGQGGTFTGNVIAVDFSSGRPLLTVDDVPAPRTDIPLKAIINVAVIDD